MGNNAESYKRRKERIKLIQPLVTQGMKPKQIADKIGLNPEIVRHLIRRHCVRPEGYVNPNLTGSCLMDSDSVGDPSILTEEQRERAKRVGITPERFAWMLGCPRDPHVDRRNIMPRL